MEYNLVLKHFIYKMYENLIKKHNCVKPFTLTCFNLAYFFVFFPPIYLFYRLFLVVGLGGEQQFINCVFSLKRKMFIKIKFLIKILITFSCKSEFVPDVTAVGNRFYF